MPSPLAAHFRDLHHRHEVLVLPNAWDTASAHIQARAGAKAVATSSAALCWALGYQDGGALPVGELLSAIRRIVRALAVPLTVDIEDGYSDSPEEVAELAAEVLRCGAVGINIEDGTAPSEILAEKIQAIRSRTGAADCSSTPAPMFTCAPSPRKGPRRLQWSRREPKTMRTLALTGFLFQAWCKQQTLNRSLLQRDCRST